MNKTLIFGREPAVIVGAIQSALALLLGFGLLDFIGLDTEADVAIVVGAVAAVSALYLAYVTSGTLLAPVLEVFKALLALGAIYGLSITAEQTGLAIAALTTGFSLYQRDRVEPLTVPSFTTLVDRPAIEPGEMEVDFDGADIEDDEEPWDDDLSTLPTDEPMHGLPEEAQPAMTYGEFASLRHQDDAWPSSDR